MEHGTTRDRNPTSLLPLINPSAAFTCLRPYPPTAITFLRHQLHRTPRRSCLFCSSTVMHPTTTFIVIILPLLFAYSLSLDGPPNPKPVTNVTVIGTVFCDACATNNFSGHSYFLQGARVRVQCVLRGSAAAAAAEMAVTGERETDKFGVYKMEIPAVDGFECAEGREVSSFCRATLLEGPSSLCNTPGLSSSSEHVAVKAAGGEGAEGVLCIYNLNALTYRPTKIDPELCGDHVDGDSSASSSSALFFWPPFGFPWPFAPPSLPLPWPFAPPPFFPWPFAPPSPSFPWPFAPPSPSFPWPFAPPPPSFPFPFPPVPNPPGLLPPFPPLFPAPPPPSFPFPFPPAPNPPGLLPPFPPLFPAPPPPPPPPPPPSPLFPFPPLTPIPPFFAPPSPPPPSPQPSFPFPPFIPIPPFFAPPWQSPQPPAPPFFQFPPFPPLTPVPSVVTPPPPPPPPPPFIPFLPFPPFTPIPPAVLNPPPPPAPPLSLPFPFPPFPPFTPNPPVIMPPPPVFSRKSMPLP